MTFWLGGHVTDLKNLYLLFRNAYGHQNWRNNNLGWGNPTFKVMWPFDYVVTWQTQKTYLFFHNTYGFQTWQNSNLQWQDPTFKVTWSFDCMVTWQIQKKYLHLHNTKATKLGRVLTYIGGIPSTTSSNLLISWKTKNLITVFPQYLEPPNLASINLRLEHSTKSCDNLITWSREKLKKHLSAFQQHLWQADLAEQRLMVGDTIPQAMWTCSQVVTWSLYVKCF